MQAYAAGKLSPADQYRVEKYLLDHPFEAEAMEGYLEQAAAFDDLHALSAKLDNRIKEKTKIIPLWKKALPFAAVFLLLISATIILLNVLNNQQKIEKVSLSKSDAIEPEERATLPPTPPLPRIKEQDNKPKAAPERVAETESIVQEIADLRDSEVIVEEDMEELVAMDIAEEAQDAFMVSEEAVAKSVQPIERAKKAEYLTEGGMETPQVSKKVVTGRVVDTDGSPLPGVNIIVKNSAKGVTTNVDGEFEIETDAGETLIASYIGMESEEVAVADQKHITIEMESDFAQLSEIVITKRGQEKDFDNSYYEAEPIGGYSTFNTYIKNNLKYPEEAIANNIQGRVNLRLTISATGKIDNIEVLKSLGAGCDEEAIRLIKEGPKWEPAKRGETKMESTVKVRIRFKQ